MITIKIGGDEQEWNRPGEVSESWITQQIVRRRDDGERPCVRVGITTPAVNMGLVTPGCAVGGGSRSLNPEEQRIVAL